MTNLSDFAIICAHHAEKFGIVNNNSHLLSFTDESESTLSDNLDIEFGGENVQKRRMKMSHCNHKKNH